MKHIKLFEGVYKDLTKKDISDDPKFSMSFLRGKTDEEKFEKDKKEVVKSFQKAVLKFDEFINKYDIKDSHTKYIISSVYHMANSIKNIEK